jgi:RNA polymerase sigma-70 factor (ECF subfamily)
MATPDRDQFDRERLTRWVREHGGAVRGYALAMLRRPDMADEVAQEVFCRAWAARCRYEDSGRPRAYLLRIADRLVCDVLRRAGREVAVDGETWRQIEPTCQMDQPDEVLIDAEIKNELTVAMESLSGPQRRVLLLRYYGQLEFAQIAATLDFPLSTVLSHCRRALLALRKLWVEQP